MFGNMMVPLDGSTMADRILPHVAAIAQVDGASITLVRVLESEDGESTPIDPLAWHFAKAEAQVRLDEAASQLAQLGLTCTTVLLEGGAAQRIVEYVYRNGVDLVVLSSHGKGGLSDWNISGIAQKVIHRAGTSIMLVRASYDSPAERQGVDAGVIQYRRILAPLDGSLRSESALPLASALAKRHGAELLVVHVATRPEMIESVPLSPEDAALAERVVTRNTVEADKYFAQIQTRLPAQTQIRVLVDDSVTRALHTLVKQEQVDLVVLSAHGHACYSEWPYSALVNSFITYGATSLFILQDIPFNETKLATADRSAESLTMPTRMANEDEGLNIRGKFDI